MHNFIFIIIMTIIKNNNEKENNYLHLHQGESLRKIFLFIPVTVRTFKIST